MSSEELIKDFHCSFFKKKKKKKLVSPDFGISENDNLDEAWLSFFS